MSPIANSPAAASNSAVPYDQQEKQLIASFYDDIPEPSGSLRMNSFMWVLNDPYVYKANIDITNGVTREVLTWSTSPQVKVTYYTDLTSVRTKFIETKFIIDNHKGVKFTDGIADLHWEKSLIIELMFDEGTIEGISETRKIWFQIEEKGREILGQNYEGRGRTEALGL